MQNRIVLLIIFFLKNIIKNKEKREKKIRTYKTYSAHVLKLLNVNKVFERKKLNFLAGFETSHGTIFN